MTFEYLNQFIISFTNLCFTQKLQDNDNWKTINRKPLLNVTLISAKHLKTITISVKVFCYIFTKVKGSMLSK